MFVPGGQGMHVAIAGEEKLWLSLIQLPEHVEREGSSDDLTAKRALVEHHQDSAARLERSRRLDELIKAALSTDSRSGLSAVRGGSGHNLYPEKQGSGVRHDLLRGNLTAWGKSGSADYSASDLPVGELIGGPERRSNGLSDILGRPSAVSSSAITAMR